MLPSILRQHYQELQTVMATVQTIAAAPEVTQQSITQLDTLLQAAHQTAQREIQPLLATIIDPTTQQSVGSLHTEIAKHLKLLSVTVNFLRVAKQPNTIQQRLLQLQDSCQRIAAYCNSITSL